MYMQPMKSQHKYFLLPKKWFHAIVSCVDFYGVRKLDFRKGVKLVNLKSYFHYFIIVGIATMVMVIGQFGGGYTAWAGNQLAQTVPTKTPVPVPDDGNGNDEEDDEPIIQNSQVTGLVVDLSSNQPVAGMIVRLNDIETVTDVAGKYAFTNLAKGEFVVSVILEENAVPAQDTATVSLDGENVVILDLSYYSIPPETESSENQHNTEPTVSSEDNATTDDNLTDLPTPTNVSSNLEENQPTPTTVPAESQASNQPTSTSVPSESQPIPTPKVVENIEVAPVIQATPATDNQVENSAEVKDNVESTPVMAEVIHQPTATTNDNLVMISVPATPEINSAPIVMPVSTQSTFGENVYTRWIVFGFGLVIFMFGIFLALTPKQ